VNEWRPHQVTEFRERFDAALRDPRYRYRILPSTTPAAKTGGDVQPDPSTFAGDLVIEFPHAGKDGVLAGWQVTLTEGETGERVVTATGLTVHLHAGAETAVWADVTMFADVDGRPVFTGEPVIVDGDVVLGTFPFWVAEIRVQSEAAG
jgi:hypothetical protein